MTPQEALYLLDGAEAILEHVPMTMRDYERVSKAYNTLKYMIVDVGPEKNIRTQWEERFSLVDKKMSQIEDSEICPCCGMKVEDSIRLQIVRQVIDPLTEKEIQALYEEAKECRTEQ